MAVNETIITGRYFRRCTDAVNKVWQRISFWHKASDCEFDDGQTAQTKVGAIKGITTSTSVTETGYVADMTTVKNLQTQIDELNSNLGNFEIKNVLYLNGNVTGTVPSGYKKSYFIPYRVSGKYSAKVNGVEVLSDTNASTFTVFEVNAGDTFITTGSTGTRASILIQV